MNYIIIGEAGSGKDTVSSLLPGTRIAFADDLKLVARLLRIRDINGAIAYMGQLFDGKEPSDYRRRLRQFMCYPEDQGKDRRLLQDLGMWAREYYADIWIDAVKAKVARCRTPVIITDCRFINEFQAFSDFHSIYVECSEDVRVARLSQRDGGYDADSLMHVAESEIKGLKELCGYRVINQGSLDELRHNVDTLMAYIGFTMTN